MCFFSYAHISEKKNKIVKKNQLLYIILPLKGTGKSVNPNQCMTSFENGMNQCAQQTLKMDMQIVLMVLNNQTLPPGQDATALKKQICR